MAESSHSSVSMSVPVFNGDNYNFWSIKMKTFFQSQDLWEIVQDGCGTSKDEKKKGSKALFFLQQALDEMFPRIMGATSAKEAWDILKEEFHGSEKVRIVKLQTLRRELKNIKMKDSETTKNYYARIKEIVNQMRAYGETISDKKVVEKILVNVTGKYDPIITAIEESKDITKLSVIEIMGSLEAYENRLSQRNEDSVESAFKSKLNIQSQKSESGWKKSKSNFKGENSRNYDNQDKNTKYPPCGIYGVLFYACQAASEEKNDKWYIDSGCSNHMTGDASIFCDIDASNKSQVRLGNGALVEVKGNGTIAIETKKGRRFIKNVLLVPNLQQNLLSVGQMIKNCYSLHFEGDSCTIYDSNNKSTVIAQVKMENQNFPIRCPTKAVHNKTPVEAWSGRKPSTKHLRVFGSICYVHIPKEKKEQAG
ncbi:hypothetical protein EZV62_010518 [Acer yangbiense]|uniref:Retrovirus-related Pol polyprotein from transposon TNT 1-94-like beta-barrel domain-containing protein n=1 Tax=Acer yangbiense TaxID=1000413 RepID=A0A5C7I362_9ROSI|nr:hypothetical protein EZV62_010518 [Acer yangbiense]